MTNHLVQPPGTGAVPELVIPVVEEQLRIAKRVVETGSGVRVHKTVSEHAHAIDETLFQEAVDVRRVSVDRIVALADAPVARQEGDTLIVPILEEVLVVERRLRIKEEVHITRTRSNARHTDTVVLKSEQVAIERFNDHPEPDMHPSTRR
jgi:uncharacterized protein (TIGR02271 family)